jgi:hypothetical protein
MVMLDVNEIKKDLMRSKNMAGFSHYKHGKLFYNVQLADGIYQFPIATVESANDGHLNIQLSEDLGETSFNAEIRGSELARWIQKAIKDNEFKKLV